MELEDHDKENQLQDERYDRTIRALTAEVALKLMKSRVAIIALNGVTTEFAKNIILDGVNVTMFDDSKITEADVGTNFMINPSDIGRCKGEVLKEKFKEMNPYSQIEIKPIVDINEAHLQILQNGNEIFKDYNILVVSTTNFKEMLQWDEVARFLNKPLFILNCCGFAGFVWISLGSEFSYRSAKPKVEQMNIVDGEVEQGIKEEKEQLEEVVIKCKSLQECLNPNVKGKSAVFYSIMMMYEAEKQNVRYDPFNPNEQDFDRIVSIGKEFYTSKNMKWNETIENTLRNFAKLFGIQFCPVYSVIGSVASQEFTKIMARNAKPSYNWFCYDSQAGYGKVEYL